MRSSTPSGIGIHILPALLMLATPLGLVFAKDAPETPLLREGRIYEAAEFLQRYTKDEAAQKRAAALYYQVALYDKAAARLVASGMTKAAAYSSVVAEAFSQGNRVAAIRVAEEGGDVAAAKAEYSRRELAEGRAQVALGYARESGEKALIDKAGASAYEEAVKSRPFIVGYRSTAPRRLRYSPDGRFIVLWNEAKTEYEVLDTRLSPGRPASERGRVLGDGLSVGGIAMNGDGRYLAIVGLTKDKSGKETLNLRLERLDTGFVVRSLALTGRFPKGQAGALAFVGDQLCVAIGKSLLLFDPWNGDIKATATANGDIASIEYLDGKMVIACWFPEIGAYRTFDAKTLHDSSQELTWAERPLERYGLGGAGLLIDEARGKSLYVPSSSVEDLRIEALDGLSAAVSGPLSLPLVDPGTLRYSGGVDAALSPDGRTLAILAKEGVVLAPFPFLDRYDVAAALAREFGATERFAPLCGHFVDEGRLDEARRLWTLAGVDERTISRLFAESKLRLGSPIDAAVDFLQAGDTKKAISIADGLVAAASSGSAIAEAFASGKAIYEKAGADLAPLAIGAGRRAETIGDYSTAVEYYSSAAAKGDIERLAFDPKLASVQWCLKAGSLLGLSEADIFARAGPVLEEQKKWSEAASAYYRLRDDESLGRVAKAALSGSDWDYALLDILKARADPGFCRSAAELLMGKGELVYAVEQYAAVNDLAGVAKVADKALDTDDFLLAADLYGSLGSKTAKASTAARLKLVFDQTSATIADAESYLAQETIDGVNAGRITLQWPITAAKAQDAAYLQIKRFGEALASLPSAPRSSEAKRCAAYLTKEAVNAASIEGSDLSERQQRSAERFTIAARILTAMGR
jgi:hypothetical protein